VRLVSPEVDKATRLGRVRIFLGDNPSLRIGAFGRGNVETARTRALAIPQSALLYDDEGSSVQAVESDKIATRRIETGLAAGGLVEVRSGLKEGDIIVTKAGTFLRHGDTVRPLPSDAKVSEAGR
jgi:multidrug efflux pump subunit AcrA (membrane-fusion protein)